MIPKVIHYCWFGGKPLSRLNQKCVDSWKHFLPDYEIKEWNEDNFDVNIVPYTQEAYQAKRWAFVSDYARFWIIYNHGGIYFDTDVEIVKPIEDIIDAGDFMGCETAASEITPFFVNPGLGFACHKGNKSIGELLKLYSTLHFVQDGKLNLTSIVYYTSDYLLRSGAKKIDEIQLVNDILIYPKRYFNPWNDNEGKFKLVEETRTIHHFAGSWFTPKERLMQCVEKNFGQLGVRIIHNIYIYLKNIKSCLKIAYNK